MPVLNILCAHLHCGVCLHRCGKSHLSLRNHAARAANECICRCLQVDETICSVVFAAFQFETAAVFLRGGVTGYLHCCVTSYLRHIRHSLFAFRHTSRAAGPQRTISPCLTSLTLEFFIARENNNRTPITQGSRPFLGIKSVRLIYFGFINLGSRDSLAHVKNNDSYLREIMS